MSRTILYVSGFSSSMRAKDLASLFEAYGPLIRCDIPAPKNNTSRVYAFIEFQDGGDAEKAFQKLHNYEVDRDHILDVQWAKQPPSSIWRFDGPPPRRDERPRDFGRDGGGRRSPPPRGGYSSDRRADRGYNDGPYRSYDDRRDGPSRSYDDRRDFRDRRDGPSSNQRSDRGWEDRRSRQDDRGRGGEDRRGPEPESERRGGRDEEDREGRRGEERNDDARDSRDRQRSSNDDRDRR